MGYISKCQGETGERVRNSQVRGERSEEWERWESRVILMYRHTVFANCASERAGW